MRRTDREWIPGPLEGAVLAVVLAFPGLAGCAAVPVSDQRLVSRPTMLFDDSAVHDGVSRLMYQVEPGAAGVGGAQSSGCTSCR